MFGYRGFSFLGALVLEVLILVYVFCDCNLSNILKTEKFPVTFYILLIICVIITAVLFYHGKIGYYLKNFLDKHCLSENTIRERQRNDSIEKLQESIVAPQKESSVTVQEIKDKVIKKKDEDFDKIFEYMCREKYELVISKTQEKLNDINSEKKEFICRFILYYAYIDSDNDKFLNDAIENLIKFIPLAKKYGTEEIYWEVRYNLMVAYARQERFDDIKKENYSYINEIQDNSKISADIKFRCYKMQAFIYLKEKNIPFAMGYFDKALKYSESDFDILFNMALTYYYVNNDVDKCLECINRIDVTRICDNDEQYRLFITMQYYCLSLKKDYFSAYRIIDNYHKSIANLSNKMKGHKAYIAYKVNKFEEAKRLSNEVLSSIPDATSSNVRGMLFIREERYQEAYDNFKSIINEFIDENKYFLGEIYYHCSYACLKLGKTEEAIDYFNKAKETGYNDFDGDYIVDLDIAQQGHDLSEEMEKVA